MKSWKALTAIFAAILLLSGGPAFAKEKKTIKADCDQTQPSASVGAKSNAPQRIEGEITKVDTSSGTVSVRGSDGAIHEFHAHPEDLQTFKVGDRLEAKLRPGC